MNLTISELFTHMIVQKNFYAMFANRLRRVFVPGMDTMAIGVRGGSVVLFVGEEFMKRASMGLGLYVLEHEMVHGVMDHIPRYLELLSQFVGEAEQRQAAEVFNIAADCADNTLLRKNKYFSIAQEETRAMLSARYPEHELKPEDGMILPENFQLPIDGSFEFYQHALMQTKKGSSPDAETLTKVFLEDVMEQHSLWIDTEAEEGEGQSQSNDESKSPSARVPLTSEQLRGLAQQIRTQLKQALKGAVNDCNKARGSIPAGVKEWLGEYLTDPIVPWWEVLATRVQATKRAKRDRGIARPNRMLMVMAEEDEDIVPALGVQRDPRFRIFFYVDTSGSMSNDSLRIAASELTHLLRADEDMEVRYMQGDCKTQVDILLKSGDVVPGEVEGRGGTDFDEYFRYMGKYLQSDETAPDLVIVYTDGYAPAVSLENRFQADTPVLWLLSPYGSPQSLNGYGEVIECTPIHNNLWKE